MRWVIIRSLWIGGRVSGNMCTLGLGLKDKEPIGTDIGDGSIFSRTSGISGTQKAESEGASPGARYAATIVKCGWWRQP